MPPSSAFEQTIALATTAFIVVMARLSIAAARRRGVPSGVTGSVVLRPGLRSWYFDNLAPFEAWCIRRGVTPAQLSYAQLIGSAVVCACYATGMLFCAGWLLLLTGTLDIVDGRVARRTGGASARGAFLDSVIDRYVESFAFFGLALFYRDSPILWAVLFGLLGSMMVSYTRARAEGLGMDIRVGVFQRPERVVVLGFGTIFGVLLENTAGPWLPGPPYALVSGTVIVIAVLTNLTAVQRIVHTWRALVPSHDHEPTTLAPQRSRDAAPESAPVVSPLRILPGKGRRVLGTFVLMMGSGIILDTRADWLGGALFLMGALVLGAGLLDLRTRSARRDRADVPVSQPLETHR